MQDTCPECGATVPAGESCQSNFHALLYRESELGQLGTQFFSSGAGQTAHFFAVSCYAIQHPRSMGYTVQTLLATRDNVASHLTRGVSLDAIRASVRQAADGKVRVLRRDGDEIHDWGVPVWPMTVADVLAVATTPQAYVEATTRWARATLDAIAGVEQLCTEN